MLKIAKPEDYRVVGNVILEHYLEDDNVAICEIINEEKLHYQFLLSEECQGIIRIDANINIIRDRQVISYLIEIPNDRLSECSDRWLK